jgi:ParB-like chromosome segregation protein Spo0J
MSGALVVGMSRRSLVHEECMEYYGVSLSAELVAFADETARQRGTSRSVLLADLLEAERVRQQIQRYLDRHGWDVADDEAAWRKYRRRRMATEYRDDEW